MIPGARPAVRVEAIPTVFHGHPDGQTTLVRFLVTGVDAPAARLRLLDARGRLLGTAGLVRRSDALAGELFVPLARPVTVRSELETPVTRGVHRTTHRLTPTPRWTVRWLTLADPAALRDRLAAVPSLLLGAEVTLLTSAGVRINPWSGPAAGRDHLDLLRLAVPALRLSAATGIPASDQALLPDDQRTVPQVREALRASGVPGVITDAAAENPRALGLDAGRARMAPLIESWLAARQPPPDGRGTLALVGTDPDVAVGALRAVEEWNGRYAYPHLELPAAAAAPPGPDTIAPADDATGNFAPAVRRAAPDEPTLEGLARRLSLPVPGIVVFNPSPFGRSDVVELPDGGLRLVTDVPGLGYAYEPAAGRGAEAVRAPLTPIENARFLVRLDDRTGGIASVVDRESGADLVAPGGALDAVAGATLSEAWVEQYAGVGLRLVVRRSAAAGGLTTRVTVYDALPWLDVETRWDRPPAGEPEWSFDLSHPVTEVTCEVAGGTARIEPPVERAGLLRWAALRGGDRTLLLATDRPAELSAVPDGRLTLRGTGSRIRIMTRRGFLPPDDPWRFGFGMLPLVVCPSPGSGPLRAPTFGRVLDVADPVTALVGLKEADDGVGVVAYLMDLGGPSRDVAVRPGLLAFDGGAAVDLAERDRGALAPSPEGGVLVPLEAGGYAAVRLIGVRLAG